MTGKLEGLNHDKGYGFVVTEKGKKFFFHKEEFSGHWVDLYYDYQKGEVQLEFEPDADRGKGPRAKNVSRIDYPNQAS